MQLAAILFPAEILVPGVIFLPSCYDLALSGTRASQPLHILALSVR